MILLILVASIDFTDDAARTDYVAKAAKPANILIKGRF
jgi:hypothetical protein